MGTSSFPAVVTLAIGVVACSSTAVSAQIATGALTGLVTSETTGAPIAGVRLAAEAGGTRTVTETDAAGRYRFDNLAPGGYLLYARSTDYVSELFDNIPCRGGCYTFGYTPVNVTGGETATANFALQPLAVIAGTFTNAATGAPLASSNSIAYVVGVYDSAGKTVYPGDSTTITDASGRYRLGLEPGTYYLKTTRTGTFVRELHNDIPCVADDCVPTAGTPLTIARDTVTTINFALEPGGRITGTVRRAIDGVPLFDVTIRLFNAASSPVVDRERVYTNADGTYAIEGLASGTYYARTVSSSPREFIEELYGGVPCPDSAGFSNQCPVTLGSPITVTAGATTAGIDFLLDPANGAIGGRVIDVDGRPLNVAVSARSGSRNWSAATDAAGTGTYTIGRLPAGGYQVRTFAGNAYLDEWHNNIPLGDRRVPDTVVVAAGGTTTIDFTLATKAATTGTLEGIIACDPQGLVYPVTVVTVTAHDATGAALKSVSPVVACGTQTAWRIEGLTPGTYYVAVRTIASLQPFFHPIFSGGGELISQLFDGIVCVAADCDPARGTPLDVAAGASRNGVNFTLRRGGRIVGARPSLGIVEVYDARGVLLPSRVLNESLPYPSNQYQVVGLPDGVYFLKLTHHPFNPAVDRVYDGIVCAGCPPTSGTPIIIKDAGRVTANFADTPGNTIGGTVREEGTAAPLSTITVEILDPTGRIAATAVTDMLGRYAVGPLAAGTYYARTSNLRSYVDERYDNVGCGACDPLGGTPVVLTAGTDRLGIDFSIGRGAIVTGAVTDTQGLALVGTPLSFFDGAGAPATLIATGSYGSYVAIVRPGTYYARTEPYPRYAQELYRDLPCPNGTCNPLSGTPIPASASVSAVDFTLASCSAPDYTLVPTRPAAGSVGLPYRQAFSANGGASPYRYALSSGVLPPGVSLDPATGVLSGTPTAAGLFSLTLGASDATGCGVTRTVDILVTACRAYVALPPVATLPGGGPNYPIDAGPDWFTMPTEGGRIDIGVTGTCDIASTISNATVSDTWIRIGGPYFSKGVVTSVANIYVDPNPHPDRFRTGYVVFGNQVVTVRQAPATSAAAFGVVDAPADGAIVSGSIAVGGWALDDLGVSRIRIYRDPVSPEPPGQQIFIGYGVFVAGARPDVEAAYRATPTSDRAGWGYLLLTNLLPNQGNGEFRLYAYADDTDGHTTLLGMKRIIANNATSTQPFGAIDTPPQGATISGRSYVNFGWALTPRPKTIPFDGSTIDVYIDGVRAGGVQYNNYRVDVATTFPGLANSGGPVGYRILDTTQLSDGVHSISWVVRDDQGAATGIGSRFFDVRNSGVTAVTTSATASEDLGRQAASLGGVDVSTVRVRVRRDDATRGDDVPVDDAGVREVPLRVFDRLELDLGGDRDAACAATYTGHAIADGELRDLPAGSSLDPAGVFSWQPGAGFHGAYELVFIRTLCDGSRTRVPVRVVIAAQ